MTRVSGLTRHLSADPAFREGYERAQSYLRIGMVVRELREAKAMTQAELAEVTELDQAEISRIENGRWGKRGISYDALERILAVFGLRITRSVQPLPGVKVSPEARTALATMAELLRTQ